VTILAKSLSAGQECCCVLLVGGRGGGCHEARCRTLTIVWQDPHAEPDRRHQPASAPVCWFCGQWKMACRERVAARNGEKRMQRTTRSTNLGWWREVTHRRSSCGAEGGSAACRINRSGPPGKKIPEGPLDRPTHPPTRAMPLALNRISLCRQCSRSTDFRWRSAAAEAGTNRTARRSLPSKRVEKKLRFGSDKASTHIPPAVVIVEREPAQRLRECPTRTTRRRAARPGRTSLRPVGPAQDDVQGHQHQQYLGQMFSST
jgi:hypothetical protein